jgi:hypothetical protein
MLSSVIMAMQRLRVCPGQPPGAALLTVVTLPDAGSARINPSVAILARAARAEDEEALGRAGANMLVVDGQARDNALVEHARVTLAMAACEKTPRPERSGKA